MRSVVGLCLVRAKQSLAWETAVLYLVIERFRGGDPLPVYRRFRDQGETAARTQGNNPEEGGSVPVENSPRTGVRERSEFLIPK